MEAHVTIWKFDCFITDKQEITVPRGATWLTTQVQHNTVCLWARVDPDAEATRRIIRVIGTGRPCEASWVYIGTVQVLDGYLVWHAFEEVV